VRILADVQRQTREATLVSIARTVANLTAPKQLADELFSDLLLFGVEREFHLRGSDGYIFVSMMRRAFRWIKRERRRRQLERSYRSTASFSWVEEDVDDESVNAERLTSLYSATAGMKRADLRFLYWYVIYVLRGSRKPVNDAAAKCRISRIRGSKILCTVRGRIKNGYPEKLREVRSVQKMLYLLYRRAGK
jgi:hypothetical protein